MQSSFFHFHAGEDRLEFAPPPQPAAVRAFALAVLAHLLLMAALTWGINWKKETENVTAEAELWAAMPQQAAPPPPQVVMPPPPPVPKVETPPPPPVTKAPDIVVEQEKRRKQIEQERAEELDRQKKVEAAKRKREEAERERKLDAKRKQDELRKEQLAQERAAEKAAEEKRKKEELAKARLDEKRREALRKENLARMMKGLEGGTGAPSSTGAAAHSSGPSTSYGARIQARVRPNIVYTDVVSGNPQADVEVRMAPDGTITSSRLVKSSGVKAWDEAVLRALAKTEVLPRDVDGRVKTPLVIGFTPN